MSRSQPHLVVEFIDRLSDYWEVVPIRNRPGSVLRRLQEMLASAERSRAGSWNMSVTVTKETLVVEFDHGSFQGAERFATLMALNLGWREADGILVGRAGRARP